MDTIFGDDTGADLNRRFNNNDRQGLYSTEYVLWVLGVLGVAWDGWGTEGTELHSLHTVQLYLLGGVAGMTSFSDRTTRWAGVVRAYQRAGRDGYGVVVIMLSGPIWPYLTAFPPISTSISQ